MAMRDEQFLVKGPITCLCNAGFHAKFRLKPSRCVIQYKYQLKDYSIQSEHNRLLSIYKSGNMFRLIEPSSGLQYGLWIGLIMAQWAETCFQIYRLIIICCVPTELNNLLVAIYILRWGQTNFNSQNTLTLWHDFFGSRLCSFETVSSVTAYWKISILGRREGEETGIILLLDIKVIFLQRKQRNLSTVGTIFIIPHFLLRQNSQCTSPWKVFSTFLSPCK